MLKTLLLSTLLLTGFATRAATPADSLQTVLHSPDFAEITTADAVMIDQRYATTNNFMGRDLYGPFNRVFLHRLAYDKLKAAIALLKQEHPTYHFILFDALRPRSVQYLLWNKVAGTPQEPYVADPKKGSVHNYGFAVDLSVVDDKGRELDMGTPYDTFSPLAEPQLEAAKLAAGELTAAQIANRMVLRKPMEAAGFKVLPNEWWHFDALPADIVRRRFTIVE